MSRNNREKDKEILSILTELQDPGYVVFLQTPKTQEYVLSFNREVFKFNCEVKNTNQKNMKGRPADSNKIIFDGWDIQYTSDAKENGGIDIYISRNQFIPKKHTFYFKQLDDLEKFKIYIKNLPKELNEASYTNLLTFVFLNREFEIINKLGVGNDSNEIATSEIKGYFTKLKFYDVNDSDLGVKGFNRLKWWTHYLSQMTKGIEDAYYLNNHIFRIYSTGDESKPLMTVDLLHTFLQEYQKDEVTMEQVRVIILKHLIGEDAVCKPQDQPDCWLSKEFSGYLFSEENDLMDPKETCVHQDMTRPLSQYWINSSHNTYLAGAQFMAKADVKAYATTLRKGVRCVEIDVWDGPNKTPMVFHGIKGGFAVTGKLRLDDVLDEIYQHAFQSSPYPVIISLENHCSIAQQKVMVNLFKQKLKEYLLTEPINVGCNELPSPEDLQYKIIIKHAKSELVTKEESSVDTSSENEDNLLQGRAFIMERNEGKWKERQFILRSTSLIYGTNYDTTVLPVYMEPWFAGEINSRETVEHYIRNYLEGVRTGDFLVRLSRGSFVLTISVRKRYNHFLIASENNEYTVDKITYFSSVRELIENYQKKFINNGDLKLKTPFHFGYLHEKMDWFQPDLDPETARTALLASKRKGAFVVRRAQGRSDMYTLEFLGEEDTHKLRVPMAEDLSITVGPYNFPSLLEGINYFHYIPIFEKIRLVAPLQRESLRVEVISDFIKSNDEERNLITGEIIEDVRFEQGNYFKDKHNLIFPTDYVRVLPTESTDPEGTRKNDFDIQEKINLIGAEIINDRVPSVLPGFPDVNRCLKIVQKDKKTIYLAMEDELENWENALANWTQATVIKNDGSDGKRPMPNLKVKISDELSNLIVYMQAMGSLQLKSPSLYNFKQICSMAETQMESILEEKENLSKLIDHHQTVCSRVYPKGIRADASNYNPLPSWQAGAQMVALNFQTGDKNLHINNARFRKNGNCGYVLKPDLGSMDPVMLTIRILEARHLTSGRPHKEAILQPHVKVNIYGSQNDTCQMETLHQPKVNTEKLNGFHPIWNCKFDPKIICNPKLAIIDFSVMEVNELAESFLGHASFPLSCCRSGVRSMMLKNEMDGALPIAKLLVDIALDSGESIQKEESICVSKIKETQESIKQQPDDQKLKDESRKWLTKMQVVIQKKTYWEDLVRYQSINHVNLIAKGHSSSAELSGDYIIKPDD